VPPSAVTAAVALGSNLGDRRSHLDFAVERLRQHLGAPHVSPFIETAPVGVAPQPDFLNGAIVGTWEGSARALLDTLLAVEAERGRTRPHPGAPRTLDLDIVLFGDRVIDEPGLTIPHPRFRERHFVLEPLTAIAPDMLDPITGLTVRQLLERLGRA
jgi:2-amino-4-hydroxy-6-hydroxymethyldihydropteridine diphosphokinase